MTEKEQKYKRIYNDSYAKVFRLCMGYTGGNNSFAKDLAQEVFLKIWQHFETFRNESSIETWIYRITVNTCLAALKKEKKKVDSVDITNLQLQEESSEHYKQEERLTLLYVCIQKLKPTNKAIILLELEGLPQQEIAKIIGLKYEALRTRVHRIKNQLIKCTHHE